MDFVCVVVLFGLLASACALVLLCRWFRSLRSLVLASFVPSVVVCFHLFGRLSGVWLLVGLVVCDCLAVCDLCGVDSVCGWCHAVLPR